LHKTRFDKLFTGVVCEPPSWVDPNDRRGKEHLGPEDTFDGDYGRLLERAQNSGKRVASPRGLFQSVRRVGGLLRRAA
jgi:hypothetical protein